MRELGQTLTESGTVLRVAPGRAWIRLARGEACSDCKGCAVSAGGEYMIAEARDLLRVSVGDEVRIRPAKSAGSQKAALLIYGVPILLLFAGYAGGQAAARAWGLDSSKEIYGVVAGFLAMPLGFVGIYLASRWRGGGIGVFRVVGIAWSVLFKAQRDHKMATTGIYSRLRHPQYLGFIIIMAGFLLQWPTIPTLAMFPVLVWIYVRLARCEEREALREFGEEYARYARSTPAFLPRLGGLQRGAWHGQDAPAPGGKVQHGNKAS